VEHLLKLQTWPTLGVYMTMLASMTLHDFRLENSLGANGYFRPGFVHSSRNLPHRPIRPPQRTAEAFKNCNVVARRFYRSNERGERAYEIIDRQT
jgi:hypothetical protein